MLERGRMRHYGFRTERITNVTLPFPSQDVLLLVLARSLELTRSTRPANELYLFGSAVERDGASNPFAFLGTRHGGPRKTREVQSRETPSHRHASSRIESIRPVSTEDTTKKDNTTDTRCRLERISDSFLRWIAGAAEGRKTHRKPAGWEICSISLHITISMVSARAAAHTPSHPAR
ncbi:uncharacterized protein LOC101220689 isoform 2 [Anopheles sinensis]|uniref:Uncharacterized protein LOC101220689 isoform 2 n=1 Tax=Anopheles sinensis TaxID=74873 RepID=A0A084VRF0_ANOSI|nr:uncharacterized protein LOC101220689 isoform 2 [Anopheles sinensis]